MDMSNNSGLYNCDSSRGSYILGFAFNFTKTALLVPLYTFILYLGVQKWKQQRSFTSASHSDIFTYHMAAFVVILGLASGLHLSTAVPSQVSYFLFDMSWYGESYINVLTCLEQYLAVVHPIIYRGLRNALGVRIRNISIGCVWMLTLVSGAFVFMHYDPKLPILFMIPFAICLVVVSFCCLSVLCVLIRSGPGEGGRVDQSKRRAFHTITAIFVVLVLWLGGITVSHAFYTTLSVGLESRCLMAVLGYCCIFTEQENSPPVVKKMGKPTHHASIKSLVWTIPLVQQGTTNWTRTNTLILS